MKKQIVKYRIQLQSSHKINDAIYPLEQWHEKQMKSTRIVIE